MEHAYQVLCDIVKTSPVQRGLSEHYEVKSDIAKLAKELTAARGVALISGFPVRTERGPVGETDGPSGIAWLARAFCELGVPVRVYTDRTCLRQIKAALDYGAPEALLVELPHQLSGRWVEEELAAFGPSHMVSLERPGAAADGVCYNARACPLDDITANAEAFFEIAKQKGVVTVAVGDGGNELGMADCRPVVERYVDLGGIICARQKAHHTLVAGVSNWWGWGLAAALGMAAQKDLLPTAEQETRLLNGVVAADGVDGSSCRFEPTVDNIPLEYHLGILARLRAVMEDELIRRQV